MAGSPDWYVFMAKACRAMEDAAAALDHNDPLIDRVHKTRAELQSYMEEFHSRMGYSSAPTRQAPKQPPEPVKSRIELRRRGST